MEERMGNPTPIGLMGLAIGCATLAPAELGLTTIADPMVWIWMLLTAGVLQVYAGVVAIINRDVLGATSFTVYGMLWLISAWRIQIGRTTELDARVGGFASVVFLLFTLYMAVGFATVSRTITVLFLSFVAIFCIQILEAFRPTLHATALVGILHVLAGVLCIWVAAGGVLNPMLGRNLFPQGAPLLVSGGPSEPDDFESLARHQGLRKLIVGAMYRFWERHAWEWVSTRSLAQEIGLPPETLAPDAWYLFERGFLAIDEGHMQVHPDEPRMVRITAAGIDYYRELQMSKLKF